MKKEWTNDTCKKEAQKYKNRSEFYNHSPSAYKFSKENNLLNDFFDTKPKGYWTKEKCFEEAKKYKSRSEFAKNCITGYQVSNNNKWLDEWKWLDKKPNAFDNIYTVYGFFFPDFKSVYFGITLKLKTRIQQHKTRYKKDNTPVSPVLKFCVENHCDFPNVEIMHQNLFQTDALIKEDELCKQYKSNGWNVLNKGKTGKNSGSTGGVPFKWSEKRCYIEAQKYKTIHEYIKYSNGAYLVSKKNGWLKNYTWLVEIYKPNGYWTRERCFEEAKKYKYGKEFSINNSSAYTAARKNKWLKDYTWFKTPKKESYWTRERCYEEAKKYVCKIDFKKGNGSAYTAARKNKWLENYTWFITKQKPKGYWTRERCYEEAKKCSYKNELKKNSAQAYMVAWKNKWLNEWF